MTLASSPPEYAVRLALPGDLAAVASCRRRWAAEGRPGAAEPDDGDFERRMEQWWTQEASRRVTWLAWSGTHAIGMAAAVVFHRMPSPGRATARWAYVSQVWVDAAYRRRGVGTDLMGAVLGWSQAEGMVRLVLNPSDAARTLYGRLGFRPADDLLRLDLG